jgi:antirestriction protein
MSEKQPNEQGRNPEEPERETLRDRPRIWVGSLADYNNGNLHGEWLDAGVPGEELAASVQRMLARSEEPGAEEFGIFDYDNFGTYRIREYEPLENVARVARGIAEHGLAFGAWAQLNDGDPSMLEQFEHAFHGEYDSASDWAREVLESSGLQDSLDRIVPEGLRPYVQVDCDMWARDARLAGDIHVEPNPAGGVWIFWAH